MITDTTRWWKYKDGVHEAVCGDIRTLAEKLQYRSDQNLKFLRLYSNNHIQSLQGGSYDEPDPYNPDRLVLNVIQSVVNAVTAKISTNRPRCMPLTEGGDWQMRQQAKQLGKFFDGQFYQSQVYRYSRQMFRDACIYGTGALKVEPDWRDTEDPQIVTKRHLIDDIFVDPVDGRHGAPRMLHEAVEMPRELAMATWPDHRSRLEHATKWRSATAAGQEKGFADPVTIGEAWHLPSSPTAGDGRHVIACDACTLVDEDWTRERFPYAFYKWLVPSLGFYGDSLAGQLVGIQIEINKILLKISQHMHLSSSFIMANRGSKIVKDHLVNTPWTLLEYTGDAPIFATMQAISPEFFAQLDSLYARAFEIAGITQLFATGLKPKGLDSGAAQREYKDSESERFMDVGQSWEELHYRDIPELMVDAAQEIDESAEGGYSVLAFGDEDDELERIAWADVNLDRDSYILQLHPTSYLPKLPAFRFQAIKELLDVSPELQPYAIKLLRYPDLEAVTKRITAPIEYIEKITDRMLYAPSDTLEDLFEPPDSFTDLPKALEISRGKLLRAKMDGAPPERLDLLMRYMTECEKLVERMAQAQAEMMQPPPQVPAAPPPAPGGGPMGDVTISPEINVPQPMPVPGR